MKKKTKNRVYISSGILGAAGGVINCEFSRSVCYYSLEKVKCYAGFTFSRYLIEALFGSVIFFAAAFALVNLFLWIKIKISK